MMTLISKVGGIADSTVAPSHYMINSLIRLFHNLLYTSALLWFLQAQKWTTPCLLNDNPQSSISMNNSNSEMKMKPPLRLRPFIQSHMIIFLLPHNLLSAVLTCLLQIIKSAGWCQTFLPPKKWYKKFITMMATEMRVLEILIFWIDHFIALCTIYALWAVDNSAEYKHRKNSF